MDRKYIGSTKTVKTQYGDIIKLGLTEGHLETLHAEIKNGWVNVAIKQGKSGDYYAEIDTFVPKQNKVVESQEEEIELEEIPF